MPLLDEFDVTNALAALHDWTGDTGRISRTVHVEGVDAESLQVEVMGLAESLNHHPVVEQHGDALTFVLWTHKAGGVTEKDVELARGIDRIVDRDEPAAPGA